MRAHGCGVQVSADPNLEPGRKAYLIQNIMVSKYIVAQQRRMQQEQQEEDGGAAGGAGAGGGVRATRVPGRRSCSLAGVSRALRRMCCR